jgi:hypothetical protein
VAQGPTTSRLSFIAATIVTVGALIAVACGSDPDPDPTPTPTPVDEAPAATDTATPEPTTEATAEPTPVVVDPHEDLLPRALTYGVPTWELRDAVITNQDPGSYVASENGRITPQTFLILDFDLINENVHINIATNQARVRLNLADGSTVDGDLQQRGGIPPAARGEARYAFEVPAETTFDGLVVIVADPGLEPSFELPLSGDAPEVEENALTEVELAAAVPLPGIDMTWTISEQWFGRDWPLPFGFRGGATMQATRAETATRWFGIVVQVQVGDCDCRGGVLDQAATVRLLIDGTPLSPESRDSSQELMNAQMQSDVMFVFSIPEGTETAVLQIGTLGDPDEQVEIELQIQEPAE